MNALRSLSVEQQVALLFLILFGLLGAATATVFVRSFRSQDSDPLDKHPQLIRDLRALWIGTLVFWLSWVAGAMGATLLFGVFSFLALREFITLAHTRRSDHRSLILAFFVVLPMQYMLVGLRSFDLFSVFIPVYVFLAIPVLSALAGDPERFLERNAKIQWGIMVCVFGLSHAPALLLLELKDYSGRGAFLLFFLVMASGTAQIVQELFSRWLRRRPVARQHRTVSKGMGPGPTIPEHAAQCLCTAGTLAFGRIRHGRCLVGGRSFVSSGTRPDLPGGSRGRLDRASSDQCRLPATGRGRRNGAEKCNDHYQQPQQSIFLQSVSPLVE